MNEPIFNKARAATVHKGRGRWHIVSWLNGEAWPRTNCGLVYDPATLDVAQHIAPPFRCQRCRFWPDFRKRGDTRLFGSATDNP